MQSRAAVSSEPFVLRYERVIVGHSAKARKQRLTLDYADTETHPDTVPLDLRLDVPFPELAQHSASVDFDSLDSHEYAHIPALIILPHAIEAFQKSHGGAIPTKTAEKKELKQIIQKMKRGGAGADHENFDEAVNMVNKAVKPTEIPSSLKQLFDDASCEKLTPRVTQNPFNDCRYS